MALSAEDRKYFELVIGPINVELIGINRRLDKINGSVQKHEKIINDALVERSASRERERIYHESRVETCPQLNRLNIIEDAQLANKVTKKFVVKSIAVAGSVMAFIWGVVRLADFFIS